MAQRVGRGIALLFHDRGSRRVEWSAARPGRTLPPGKTRYTFYRRLGGPQGQSGRAENLVPTGIRSQTIQPSQSLYRLSCPANTLLVLLLLILLLLLLLLLPLLLILLLLLLLLLLFTIIIITTTSITATTIILLLLFTITIITTTSITATTIILLPILLHVSFDRKSHVGINYELVMQAKTRPKPVSAVHYSPHLTHTPNCHQLTDFRPDGAKVRLKLPSNEVTPKHPRRILNTHFYIFFKLCNLASDLLAHYGPQAPMILTFLCHSHL